MRPWDITRRVSDTSTGGYLISNLADLGLIDPAKEFGISLVWPTAGSWSLNVVPVSDAHDRMFMPAPKPTELTVNVVP